MADTQKPQRPPKLTLAHVLALQALAFDKDTRGARVGWTGNHWHITNQRGYGADVTERTLRTLDKLGYVTNVGRFENAYAINKQGRAALANLRVVEGAYAQRYVLQCLQRPDSGAPDGNAYYVRVLNHRGGKLHETLPRDSRDAAFGDAELWLQSLARRITAGEEG